MRMGLEQKWILINMNNGIRLIIFLLLLVPALAKSQDIEGIPLGSVLSEELVKETFGRNYSRQEYIHFPCKKETVYIWGRDSLFFDGRNRLVRANLSSRRFTVDKNSIPGGYRKGDRFCEDIFNRYGIVRKSNCYENVFHIYDEEEICTLEVIQLHKNRISSVILVFPYGDDVEGVGINELVTKEEIEEKFGVPFKLEEEEFMSIPSSTYIYTDNGKESFLIFSKKGRLLKYEISSPKFKTFTETIPGGLSVGDNIEQASTLFDNEGRYLFFQDWDNDTPALLVKDGKISVIGYFIYD